MTTKFPLVVLSLTVGVLTAFGLLWLRNESLEAIEPVEPPVWMPATKPNVVEQRVTFTVTRGQETTIPRGTWSGTVSRLGLTVGDNLDAENLAPGAPAPIAVDGVDRPWLLSDEPLYRSIGAGMSGGDVDTVARFLVDWGYDPAHEPGTAVKRQMVNTIRAWALDQGFGKGRSAFDPAWITWVSPDHLGQRVAGVNAKVGIAASDVGADFIKLAAPIVSIAPPADSGTLSPTPMLGGTTEQLIIGDIGYDWADRTLTPEAARALDELVAPGATETSLVVRRSYPPDAVVVPITALVQTLDGGYCLVAARDDVGTSPSETTATILGSSVGVAIVEGPLDFVLANPAATDAAWCKESTVATR